MLSSQSKETIKSVQRAIPLVFQMADMALATKGATKTEDARNHARMVGKWLADLGHDPRLPEACRTLLNSQAPKMGALRCCFQIRNFLKDWTIWKANRPHLEAVLEELLTLSQGAP